MDKVKVAFVGCGGIANWHFSRIGKKEMFPDVELVGYYDIVTARAEKMAAARGEGKVYTDLLKMYDDAKPDAVYVCVPPDQHGCIEMEAIKRGIHLLIQKPICTELSVAEKICDMATQYNIIISVGFQDRYLDLIDPMKEWLDGKEIGLINGAWVGGIPGVYWWRRRSTSGGQVVEQNIHLYDMLRYLIGEPVSVYTAGGKGIVKPGMNLIGYDVEDYTASTVKFKNGSVANIFTGDYIENGGGMKCGLTFYAKDATIDYELRNKVVLTDKDGQKEVKTEIDQGIALDRTFLDAVKTGDASKIRSPYYDAIKSMKFTLATNTSLDTGKAVYLNL